MSSPRSRLADALRVELAGAGVNVYAAPPDVLAVPAIVIAPATPYRRDTAMTRELWAFDLLALVTRPTDPAASFDALDELIGVVRATILAMPGATWAGAQSIGDTLPVGGITYLSAVCSAEILSTSEES